MSQRKAIMEDEADAFVIVPGGIGTYEEFFEMYTLLRLRQTQKPIAVYNLNGYYQPLMDMLQKTAEKGFMDNLDSYIVIEHLDNDLNTISTLYYGVGNIMLDMVYNIKKTKDGVIIVHDSYTLDHSKYITHITKFPASAFGFENIEEAHAHNLHLAVAYPNPGGDVLNIRTGLRNATLQVYDMQGRIIHQQIITDEVTSIDASKWNSGTYIWNLKTENGKLKVEEGKWVK